MSAWRALHHFLLPLDELAPVERAIAERERTAFNRRRLLVVGGAAVLIHLGFLILYTWFVASSSGARVVWQRNLQIIQGIMAVLMAVLVARAYLVRNARGSAEVTALLYIAYGTAVGINRQLVGFNIDVFLSVLLCVSAVFRVHGAPFVLGSLVGLALLVAGVDAMQPSSMARFSVVANAVPIMLVAWVLSRAQMAAFVREIMQQHTIERQRDELATLNDRLDRQLRIKVADRSRELSLILQSMGRTALTGELQRGAVLRDCFVIDTLIGEGGMGAVYRAHDRLLDRQVALKVLSGPSDVTALQRFLREVEAMSDVAHPAVVRSFHVDASEEGRLFQVQELVCGEALDRVQRRLGKLCPVHATAIGAVLADALAAAHAAGVVHRDIKPANVILIDSAPGLKLLDFGISKLRSRSRTGTRSGVVLGTLAFMAPEQLSTGEEARESADLYSLGVTIFLLLTGELPPRDGTGATLLADVPAPLASHVMACLDPSPSARPTATELCDQLRQLSQPAGGLAAHNRRIMSAGSAAATLDS